MSESSKAIDYGERGRVLVVANAEELARRAADTFASETEGAVVANGAAYVALSGGSTPKAMGQLLARPPYVEKVPWKKIDVFWGDERWAPLSSEESNAGEAKRAFLDLVPIDASHVHSFETVDVEPDVSAAQMEAKIRSALPLTEFPPRFDLVLLGMGEDGHTASLFPGTRAIHEDQELVVANKVPKLDTVRLTFTPRLLNAARNVVFLVTGAAKAEPLRHVLEDQFQPDLWPSQVIRPDDGTLTWLVDEAAAAKLSRASE
jgi:6-phosphogluconolactonase